MKHLLVLLLAAVCVETAAAQTENTCILPWRRQIERRIDRLEREQRAPQQPAPAPQPIIIVQPSPYQQLPIPGQPLQPLPVPGQPLQPLPQPGVPLQPLPPQGQPQQPLPLQPGSPGQPLPLGQAPQIVPLGQPQQYSRSYALYRPY